MAARLQLDDALIAKMYEDGNSGAAIAKEFGVSTDAIYKRVKEQLGSCRSRSEAQKTRPPTSEETLQRMRDASTGRTHTEESIQKIREAKMGHAVSEEARQKISDALTGRIPPPFSEEHKRRISEGKKGKKRPPITDVARENMRIGQSNRDPMSDDTKEKIGATKRGELHHNWKGGKAKDSRGYIYVLSPEHPYASRANRVCEHRLVMEEHIGRYVEPHEVIHHIDGVTNNNTIENLFLFPTAMLHMPYSTHQILWHH
jgi:transposase